MTQSILHQKAVFTLNEFYDFASVDGSKNRKTQYARLRYYLKTGKIINIQRGLYAVVAKSQTPETTNIDPYLIAGKLTEDAIIAYHSALQLHGVAYSVYEKFYYLSKFHKKLFTFRQHEFQNSPFPNYLLSKHKETVETEKLTRQGVSLIITSLERTIVDILDKPSFAGGWEDIIASLDIIGVIDIEKVINYALLLENSTLISKLGFFLERYQSNWGVSEKQLKMLYEYLPKSKHYLVRNKRESGKYIARWKLVIPEYLFKDNEGEF